MSFATTRVAPHSTDAMADEPHPLPTSKTDFPLTTEGLSRIYLHTIEQNSIWDVVGLFGKTELLRVRNELEAW